jgi:outer membrane protein assembly factor BamB
LAPKLLNHFVQNYFDFSFSMRRLLIFFFLSCTCLRGQNSAGSSNSSLANDEWPLFRGDSQLTGISHTNLPNELELLWAFKINGDIESAVAIAGGTVYATSLDSHLYAIDLNTGKIKWKFRAGHETKSSPAVSNHVVYFGDDAGVFHAVDAQNGKQKWKFQTDAEILSSANIAGDRVLFGSYDNHLYCLSSKDGAPLWKFETDGYIHGTPAIVGENVTVTGCDGFFRMIRISDGVETKKISAGAYVAASAAILNSRAYFGTFGNKVLCLDLLSAKLSWEYDPPQRDFPFYASAAVTDEIVVVAGRDKMLHGLNPQTGKALWTFSTKAKIDSSPVIAGQRVFFGAVSGEIFGIDLNSGKAVWQFETGSSIVASPSIANGKLIIGTTDGVLYCFGER